MSVDEARIESLFFAALDISSPAERAAFLERSCGQEPDLRRRVDELLGAQPRLGDFLQASPLVETLALTPVDDAIGTVVGPYLLRERLGEGGMGTVYVAEQERPVRRTVALKVIKPGMDTRDVIARFEAERQALALMDHPCIAKVLDVGTTESGRPYFVMELISGTAITTYCDQRQLSPRERLALFIRVCQGMQHAHQKGIVHRDIKPSNVLVARHDDVAVPKIIDFGVAKAIEQRLTERTIYTRFAQVIGTPLYMSPEQAELSALDIDARSDVYSLGVLLYELLTGTTPFDSETLQRAGFDGMRKIIREDEPPRPSNRVSTLDAKQRSTVSERRGIDYRRLKRMLRGDLDWIVMKALEKDRYRRYESAGALAADLQRFLDDKPVEARPPSLKYRLWKFARRNRSLLGTAALLALGGPPALLGVYVFVKGTERSDPFSFFRDLAGQGPSDDARSPTQPVTAPHPAAPTPSRILPGLVSAPVFIENIGHWQIVTKRPRGVLKSAVWSPDEQRIAMGEANNVRIYDAANMRLLRVLVGHTLPVTSIAWHPGGERLASASEDGTVRLWSDDGTPTHLLTGHSGVVYQVAWRPDGERLASASADGTVRLWNSDATVRKVIEDGERHIFCIGWSPDGKLLAAAGGDIRSAAGAGSPGDNSIRLWDADTGALVRRFGGTERFSALSLDWRPDGNQLVVGYGDVYRASQEAFAPLREAGIRLWNIDGTAEPQIGGPIAAEQFGSTSAVAWDSEGKRLAFGGRHGIIRVWDAETQVLLPTPSEYALDINRIQWRRNGSRLMATSRAVVREWDAGPSLSQVLYGLAGSGFLTVRWSPDGSNIAASNYRNTFFWNADGAPAAEPAAPADLHLRWWDRPTSKVRPDGSAGPELEGAPQRVREWAWNRNRMLACATWSDTAAVDPAVRIWDERGRLLARVKGHRGGVESVDWNPAGDWLASGGGDSVRLWRPNGSPGPVMTGHTDEVYPVAWSPDGRWIASAGSDSTIRLWKPDGSPGPVLRGHQGGIHDIAWSPDSQRIVSASWLDSTLRVWNVETLRTEWQVLLLEPDALVTLSPSGQPWHGNRSALESGVSYLVERRDGATEIKAFGEFRRRHVESFVALYGERCRKAMKEQDWQQAESSFADAGAFLVDGDLSIRARIQEIGDKLAQALEAAGERDRAAIVREKGSAAGSP